MRRSIFILGIHHTYQFAESEHPSDLERQQREKFNVRIRKLVSEFEPNIFADESPDTNNLELLSLFPQEPICVDVPFARKVERGLFVGRPPDTLCPYIDGIRERFWRWKLYRATKDRPWARVLLLCGAQHLYKYSTKPISLPDQLSQVGYDVRCLDIRTESWWDESWTKHWVEPSPRPPIVVAPCCLALGTYVGVCRMRRRM